MCSTNEPKVRGLTSATRKAESTVREACSMKVAPGGAQNGRGAGRLGSLEASDGQTAAPVPLEEEEGDDQGEDRHEGTRDDEHEQGVGAGLDERALVPGLQADGQREQLVVVEHHQRQEEVVPGA